MHFDLNGAPIPRGNTPVKVNLRFFGVLFEGKDLQPADNPHTVPGWFAHDLVHSGRAFFAPDEPVVTPPVKNGDPVVQNRDPKPRGQR